LEPGCVPLRVKVNQPLLTPLRDSQSVLVLFPAKPLLV
jgi:hypothetical protein